MAAMTSESKPVGYFNLLTPQVNWVNEGSDSSGVFQYPGEGPTNQLISEQETLTVNFSWSISGVMHIISDVEAKLQVFLECMGSAEASPGVYSTSVLMPMGGGTASFSSNVTIPVGLPVALYRLSATLTCKAMPSGLYLPSAAFIDLGFIQVYPNS